MHKNSLLSKTLLDWYSNLIFEGTKNKYEIGVDQACNRISSRLFELLKFKDEQTLVSEVFTYKRDDGWTELNNLCVCVTVIENFWRVSHAGPGAISRIFSILSGIPYEHTVYRHGKRVADFDSELEVNSNEVVQRFAELELFADFGVRLLQGATLAGQCEFLAFVHGRLIAIHPFEDANGRVARYWVQYALRCWNLPPTPLPKVRNDQGWKDDLGAAIQGNPLMLARNIERRVRNSVVTLAWPNPLNFSQ